MIASSVHLSFMVYRLSKMDENNDSGKKREERKLALNQLTHCAKKCNKKNTTKRGVAR